MTNVLDATGGIRGQGIAYEVTDSRGRTLGTLRGHGGTLAVSTAATRIRTLTGVRFDATDLADLNPFTDWVRPLWLVDDGGMIVRYALGLLCFVADPQKHSSGLVDHQVTLHDGSAILDTPMVYSLGGTPGSSVQDAARACAEAAGVPEFTIEASSARFLDPVANIGGSTTYRQFLLRCCSLTGWLPPHFDRDGTLRLRYAPPLDREADVTYTNARVVNGSRVTNPNLLNAPNAHRVSSNGPVGTPISAIAYVDPLAPHSREHRNGLVILKDHQLQGIESQAQAEQMAAAFAAADPATFETVDFEGAADPRHDVFSVVRLNGTNYLETEWRLPMSHDARHSHHLQRTREVSSV